MKTTDTSSVISLIGNTPLLHLEALSAGLPADIWVKIESRNPAGSVKDRMALAMLSGALERGDVQPGGTVVESTSGNTGIALALLSASLGIKFIAVMPESMSIERRKLIQGYGAKLILTPAKEGMAGANAKAAEIAKEQGAFYTRQFENPDNPRAHREGTGPEIIEALAGMKARTAFGGVEALSDNGTSALNLGAFVAGVGTGGTITGVAEHLKAIGSSARIVAVEPEESPVLSGGAAAPHKIQGIGAGFVPPLLKTELLDKVLRVSGQDAITMARRLRLEFGISCGISSGANVAAALRVAQQEESRGLAVVTIICDTGERYLSTPLFGDNV